MNSVPPTILVVDDDPSVRTALRRLLVAAGYAAETFAGPEALLPRGRPAGPAPGGRLVAAGYAAETSAGPEPRLPRGGRAGPGCLLLALQLAAGDGFEVQGMLARAGIDLPIVFLTGHGDVHSAVRAMKD